MSVRKRNVCTHTYVVTIYFLLMLLHLLPLLLVLTLTPIPTSRVIPFSPRAIPKKKSHLLFPAALRRNPLANQLATFHPQYRFEGSEEDDASNYTNRSPYPVLHLLLEDQVSICSARQRFRNFGNSFILARFLQ